MWSSKGKHHIFFTNEWLDWLEEQLHITIRREKNDGMRNCKSYEKNDVYL